jgi:SAM-dependent methyltransferase
VPRIDSEKFYNNAILKHGLSAKGVNWISKETQDIRFDTILKLLPKDIVSLVDAGCGFGDFYLYLKKRKRLPLSYIGVDSLQKMQNIALKQTNQKILLANILKDTIPHANYYICSGAMNILTRFETHLFIRNCFMACERGFIFNILHGEEKNSNYNYLNKKEIEDIAKILAVKNLKIITGYMKNDITVGFFKQ